MLPSSYYQTQLFYHSLFLFPFQIPPLKILNISFSSTCTYIYTYIHKLKSLFWTYLYSHIHGSIVHNRQIEKCPKCLVTDEWIRKMKYKKKISGVLLTFTKKHSLVNDIIWKSGANAVLSPN